MDENKNAPLKMISPHCKEVRFASFISGGFTMASNFKDGHSDQLTNQLMVWRRYLQF